MIGIVRRGLLIHHISDTSDRPIGQATYPIAAGDAA